MGIWFCQMEYECPKQWDELKKTDDPNIRDCDACGKPVHFISTENELEDAAMKGSCVAFYNNESMPEHVAEQYKRIWQMNKPKTVVATRITMGLPSSAGRREKLLRFFDDIDNKKIE